MKIILPLRQHVGAPCVPIVKKGDSVKKGELIAKPNGLGANIHSSVYGKVKDITDTAVIITPKETQKDDYVKIKKTKTHLEAIEEAGIVGAGGAGFPAHVKFNIDLTGGYVIANAAECEPVLDHNMEFIENSPEILIRGLKYVQQITKATKAYIAIKAKHKKAVSQLKKLVYLEENVEVKILPDMYPAGDERVIVREILGVELQPGELPLAAKAVISNVETLKRVVEAIEDRKPVITKDITVGGRVQHAEKGKVFMDVPLGEPIGKYIDLCGGYMEPHGEIVAGGPFTGKHAEEDDPILKITGGILVGMPFPQDHRKVGLLACECGAGEDRLKELAAGMGMQVVAVEKCKRMVDVGGRLRCDLPGVCPGQAEKVLSMRKQGADVLLVGSCGD